MFIKGRAYSLCSFALTVGILQGCAKVDWVRTAPDPCLIVERGIVKHLYVIGISGGSTFLPAPGFLVKVLNETTLAENDQHSAWELKNHTPDDRRLSGGSNAIDGIVYVALAGQHLAPNLPQWIVGNSPIVVAIGKDPLPDLSGQTAPTVGIPIMTSTDPKRLLTDVDLDRMVTDLFILKRGDASDSRTPRHIQLTPPQTLRQAIESLRTMENLSRP